jgi:hypoxanthine-DNA glycosylase
VIAGFAPIAWADARVLILGTVPSRRSLEAGQYYAHPRNAFWPIVERLFARDASPDNIGPGAPRLDYETRVALLREARVALWDVLRAAERPGSLDADISAPVANDFAAFFARHPAVRTVCFNGTKARALWVRHVAPALPARLEPGLVTLPSTSPANAAPSFDDKLAAWQVVRDAVIGR